MGFLGKLISPITDIVGKFVKDKDLAQQLTAQLNSELVTLVGKELDAQRDIVLAEAKGGWLQRNWRPLMMVFFATLIGVHWFGMTPENLTDEAIADLYELIKIGIGGYVIGRSAEKIVPQVMNGRKGG